MPISKQKGLKFPFEDVVLTITFHRRAVLHTRDGPCHALNRVQNAALWGRRGHDLLLLTTLQTLPVAQFCGQRTYTDLRKSAFLKVDGTQPSDECQTRHLPKVQCSGILSLFSEGLLRQEIQTRTQETEIVMWLTKALGSPTHDGDRPRVRVCKPIISISEERGGQKRNLTFPSSPGVFHSWKIRICTQNSNSGHGDRFLEQLRHQRGRAISAANGSWS